MDIKYIYIMFKRMSKIANYQQLYLKLFNKITDVIEELRQVQRETEELYIQSAEPGLTVLKPKHDGDPEK